VKGWENMKRIIGMSIIASVLACMLSFIGCSNGDTTSTSQVSTTSLPSSDTSQIPHGELTYAAESYDENFDPATESADSGLQFGALIMDTLFVSENGKTQGKICESWEMPTDTTWIFHIRKGIKFHNGDDLTADDVVFTINHATSEVNLNGVTAQLVDSVEKVDDYTVRVNTKGFQPYLLVSCFDQTRLPDGEVIPKKYTDTNGFDYFSDKPVGAGPYKFVSKVSGDSFKLESNTNYWLHAPEYKYLNVVMVPEEATRVAMLRTKQVDMIEITVDSSAELLKAGFTLKGSRADQIIMPNYGTYLSDKLPTGSKIPPLCDIRVREALSRAINRNDIIDNLFSGQAFAGGPQPVHPNSLYIDYDYWQNYEADANSYDVDKAKQLLKDAGYANGFDIDVVVIQQPYLNNVAQAVQGYWKAIGVNATIIPMDFSTFIKSSDATQHPEWIGRVVFSITSAGPVVPNQALTFYKSSRSMMLMGQNTSMDTLLQNGLTETDETKRTEYWNELIKTIVDSRTCPSICRVPNLVAMSSDVEVELPAQPTTGLFGFYLSLAKHK
jgi:peptide/nickel transport system substrate-binding protein